MKSKQSIISQVFQNIANKIHHIKSNRWVQLALTTLFLSLLFIGYQNCGNGFKTVELETDSKLLSSSSPDCVFNGAVVPNSTSITAYSTSTVASGSQCVSEERVCSEGSLSGSFSFPTCTPGVPANCLFNNQTVDHGKAVKAYQSSMVPFGQTCQSEERTCNNGMLSGTLTFAACNVGGAASCMFNGQTIAHGQSVAAYQTSSIGFGETCAMETRNCQNGTLSGSFQYSACSPRPLGYADLMVGTWTIPCQAENGYRSYQSRFMDGELEVLWRSWDKSCTVLYYEDYQRMKVSEVVETPDATGTTFTWKYDSLEDGLKPHLAAYTDSFNRNKECGKTGYVTGQYLQNVPATCGAPVLYWRARLQKNGNTQTLMAADANTGAGTSPETRPTGLDQRPAYIRTLQIGNTVPNPKTSGSLRP